MTGGPKIRLSPEYAPRSVRPLETWEHDGWTLKVYGISQNGEYPRPSAVEAGKRAASETLPTNSADDNRYGVGFLGVHDAAGGCYLFVDWWEDENELHHRPFVAPADDPFAFTPVPIGGSTACTWDLAVIAFERDAWVRDVLARGDGPAVDAYLEAWLRADI